jgi:hypothetical protein
MKAKISSQHFIFSSVLYLQGKVACSVFLDFNEMDAWLTV